MRPITTLVLLIPLGLIGCSDPKDDESTDSSSPEIKQTVSASGTASEALVDVPPGTDRAPGTEPDTEALCDCELSSWIVAGRGRHLHLDIDCPEEFDHLDGRIEYTSAALRIGFDPSLLPEGALPPLARMTPGYQLMSPISDPQPRSEATYTVTPAIAAWMQRDLVFSEPYILLGSNSNAAMRAMLETAGLALPERVLNGKGFLGEFPGIDKAPGDEIPAERWADFGLPEGPKAIEGPLPDGWDELPAIGVNTPSEATDEATGTE